MIEGIGWIAVLIAGVAALIAAFVHPRDKSPAKAPVAPPDPEPTQVAQTIIENTASGEIDAIMDDLQGEDPAGDIADALNRARRGR